MPSGGKGSHSCAGCSHHMYQDADAHLLDYAEGLEGRSGNGMQSGASSAPSSFCPGASIPAFAPDLLLEPIHLDVTLHVELDQQCLVVDEVLTVRLNVPTKSNTFSLSLDGIGFQYLHASRLTGASSTNPSPTPSPRGASTGTASTSSSRAVSLDYSSSQSSHHAGSHSNTAPGSSKGIFSFLRSHKDKAPSNSSSKASAPSITSVPPASGSLASPSKSKSETLHSNRTSMDASATQSTTAPSDSTSFYCTYDGRKMTLSWIGPEAFGGGLVGTVEKVRLIYLVDKPITGLYFTKPPTEVELELLEQQQKPMVATTYATKKDEAKGGASSKSTSSSTPSSSINNSMAGRMSPFHASRPLLACTDHETERARYWLASIDHPNVRPTAKWTFVVKAGLTAIANGELLPTLSETAIPHWPLSLFNPPITSPKPPTYPKALFVWNNPYPTASYLIAFAVGQLHYVEAVAPRHGSSASNNLLPPPAPSSLTLQSSTSSSSSSGGGGHKRTKSIDGSSSQSHIPDASSHHVPTTSTAEKRSSSQRLGAISETSSYSASGSSSSAAALSASRASLDDFDLASSMTTNSSFNPFSAFLESSEAPAGLSYVSSMSAAAAVAAAAAAASPTFSAFPSTATHTAAAFHAMQVARDVAHHKKTSRKREEAEWILKDIPMRYYTPRNVPLTTLQLMLNRTPEIMRWLQARVGLPFPYSLKYYQFVAPELPSAMENVTLTTWGSDYLLNSVWAQEYGPSTESINVHEMAHSYFGNSVGIAFWDHAWLKEGWANYMECCWQEDKYGDDAMAYMLHRNGKLYMKECDHLYVRPLVTRVYDSSWDLYDQHLYRGGSRRIHSLRCLLGDDVFWPAVTDYLRSHQGILVETDDFRKMLERHAHRNLQPFFNQWIYSPGYPNIQVTYEYNPNRQQINISARQTQMDEKRGIGTFDMAIPIDIAYLGERPSSSSNTSSTTASTGSSGASGVPSGSSDKSKVKWTKTSLVFSDGSPEAHITIPLPSPPLQIIFDKKQSWIFNLTMDPGFTVLRTMALHCWSVPHRIWAAQALLDRGSPQEIEVISEMLLHREQHWGVIADVAVMFAKSHRANIAAPVLAKLLLSPPSHPAQHPRALMSIALALGHIKDPRIATAIRQYLAIKKYTTLHKIDQNSLRSIASWSSISSLVALSELSDTSDDTSLDDDDDDDYEEGYYTVEQPGSASSKKKAPSSKSSSGHTSLTRPSARTSLGGRSLTTPQNLDDLSSHHHHGHHHHSNASSATASGGSATAAATGTGAAAGGDNTIPYKTHGRLLESLAAQADPSDEALLFEQAERTRYGWLGITRGSALLALSEYGSVTAYDYILDATRVSSHQHMKARGAAVAALARCLLKAKMSPPLVTRTLHTLHLLLHEPNYSIRFAAVHALFKIIPQLTTSLAHESLAQIHHMRKTLSNQDRMWVKRKRLLLKAEAARAAAAAGGQGPSPSSLSSASFGSTPPATNPSSTHSSGRRHYNPSAAPAAGPTMEEFLALKNEFAALKSRVKAIEQSLEDSDDDEQAS